MVERSRDLIFRFPRFQKPQKSGSVPQRNSRLLWGKMGLMFEASHSKLPDVTEA